MSGYLTRWRDQPDSPAGRILMAISDAGDRYHHTEDWEEDEYGESCMAMIERVVTDEIRAAVKAERDRVIGILELEIHAIEARNPAARFIGVSPLGLLTEILDAIRVEPEEQK